MAIIVRGLVLQTPIGRASKVFPELELTTPQEWDEINAEGNLDEPVVVTAGEFWEDWAARINAKALDRQLSALMGQLAASIGHNSALESENLRLQRELDQANAALQTRQQELTRLRLQATLAPARTLTLGVEIAKLMHIKLANITYPRLEGHAIKWSVVTLTGQGGKMVEVFVPVFDDQHRFAIVDYTQEAPRKRWLRTLSDGTLSEEVIERVRGFAGFVVAGRENPTQQFDNVTAELEASLREIIDSAAARISVEDQLTALVS